MATGRFERGALVDQAVTQAGEDDFGAPGWEEPLEILLDSLQNEARLNDIGVEIATGDVVTYLSTRLALTAWRRDHPEVAQGVVERPIVIVGQPRTGTTILFDLLAQDDGLRAPLTWEVDLPVPPPLTATFDTDPRIAEVQAKLDMAETLIPGFGNFHAMGAQLAQECVRITAGDFRSMIFPTQYRVPAYNRWLLHEADLAPAYRWHRRYLEHLQSAHPVPQWLLKSPAHLWHLDAMTTEYPGAVVVQTHRDPLKVIASVSALATSLRRMASDENSVAQAAPGYADDIFLGLDRGMAFRDGPSAAAGRIIDVQYAEFLADPLATVGRLYDDLGRPLTADTERRMRAFLAGHPGDGGGGRYSFADTGLDAGAVRERARPYQERFGVASEPVV